MIDAKTDKFPRRVCAVSVNICSTVDSGPATCYQFESYGIAIFVGQIWLDRGNFIELHLEALTLDV